MAFHKPPIGKRGYNEDEVDAFLDIVESELCRLDGTPGRPGAGQQTSQRRPPQIQRVMANDGSIGGRGLRSIGSAGWLTAIVAAGVWLYMCGSLAWDAYGYQIGTPATATHVTCAGSPNSDARNVNCSGTWSIGGQSHDGTIHRVPENWNHGQPLDVRVHGSTAFAAGSTGWFMALSILVLGVFITMSLGGFRALDRRWRQWLVGRRQRS